MQQQTTPDQRLAGNTIADEFARLALELSVLDPETLIEICEEILRESATFGISEQT